MIASLADGKSGCRVLVVDDDEDTRFLYTELLELSGHTVVTAEDGEAALAAMALEEFDVVMLDLTLPKIDGAEVARRTSVGLGAKRPRLFAMSGHPRGSQPEADALFDAYFIKPVNLDDVLEALASITRGDAPAT